MKFLQDLIQAIRGKKDMEIEVNLDLDERHLILISAVVLFIIIYAIT